MSYVNVFSLVEMLCFSTICLLNAAYVVLKYARRVLIHADSWQHILKPNECFDSFSKYSIFSFDLSGLTHFWKLVVTTITAFPLLISIPVQLLLLSPNEMPQLSSTNQMKTSLSQGLCSIFLCFVSLRYLQVLFTAVMWQTFGACV